MKRCEQCGTEYEDSLEKCPACAKRRRQYLIAGIVVAVAVIAVLKFVFIF
jgi:RNA polymerase subunit RPABC4/transcription elongation factor Spt4